MKLTSSWTFKEGASLGWCSEQNSMSMLTPCALNLITYKTTETERKRPLSGRGTQEAVRGQKVAVLRKSKQKNTFQLQAQQQRTIRAIE